MRSFFLQPLKTALVFSLFTLQSVSPTYSQDLLKQYKTNIFYPIMNYESAYIEDGHAIGLHLPDYMALGSLKYTFSDTANFSISIGMGLPTFQLGFQKHLISIWNYPVNMRLSTGLFINGYWVDAKIITGLYLNKMSNLSGTITYGKYWAGLGPVNFTDEKYFQVDAFYLFKFSRSFSSGVGFGSGICYYKDERDQLDTTDKVKPGTQTRRFWQGAFIFKYNF